MNTSSSVSVATFNNSIWICIKGRASFKSSTDLRDWIQPMIEKNVYNYVIDLIDCDQMDSTFMGTMAGIAQRLRAKKQGLLRVINANEVNRELMEGLGLDQLFTIQRLALGKEMPPEGDHVPFETISHRECSQSESEPTKSQDIKVNHIVGSNLSKKNHLEEVVLSAHEALIGVKKSNEKKFKNLLEVMRRRLLR